jgi:hypothetical protein
MLMRLLRNLSHHTWLRRLWNSAAPLQDGKYARHRWLTPIILATQEAEIRRIVVWSQPEQIVPETLPRKYPSHKRAGGVAQGDGPEFKPQYRTHTKKVNISYVSYHITHQFYTQCIYSREQEACSCKNLNTNVHSSIIHNAQKVERASVYLRCWTERQTQHIPIIRRNSC